MVERMSWEHETKVDSFFPDQYLCGEIEPTIQVLETCNAGLIFIMKIPLLDKRLVVCQPENTQKV